MSSIINNQNYNPLLDINTSFKAYLDEHTRTYTDHIVSAGRLDYSFDGDFAMRSRINNIPGWSKLYKAVTSSDIPNKFRKLFKCSDMASSMVYSNIYKTVGICSGRMQLPVPPVLVKKASDKPEIYSLAGEGLESCLVISSDIADMCSAKELLYLIGCELGRLQNRHTAYNYAFTYPGISRSDKYADNEQGSLLTETAQLSYNLNRWLCAADITADRAGIICLDEPSEFAEIFASVRKKFIPDSFGNTNEKIDLSGIMERYETFHTTPVRALNPGSVLSQDERRIYAGMEFTTCEVLFSWRPELDKSSVHITGKQSLEIRCEVLTGMDPERLSE